MVEAEAEAWRTLGERRDWLTERIAAKLRVRWDVEYDTRERDALALILRTYRPASLGPDVELE